MKLEQQVCSLELAKKLKELGVKQESLFWYDQGTRFDGNYDIHHKHPVKRDTNISAFTVAELGEMLPEPNARGWVDFAKLIGGYVLSFKVNS